MADIELVIKIPEVIMEYVKRNRCLLVYTDEVANAVLDGTPLPKGHDRLIEANEDLYQEIRRWAGGDVASHIIANAQVIVEADKESE